MRTSKRGLEVVVEEEGDWEGVQVGGEEGVEVKREEVEGGQGE